jgi:hypothetical protein
MINCFVDESGKSKNSSRFLVCVCIFEDVEKYQTVCLEAEKSSRKGQRKWHKSSHERRTSYLDLILGNKMFQGKIYFSDYKPEVNYDEATIQTIARAVKIHLGVRNEKAKIFIDGLSHKKVTEYSNALKAAGIKLRKIRGVQDESSNPLIRLADSVAGFLMDALSRENKEAQANLKEALEMRAIKRV